MLEGQRDTVDPGDGQQCGCQEQYDEPRTECVEGKSLALPLRRRLRFLAGHGFVDVKVVDGGHRTPALRLFFRDDFGQLFPLVGIAGDVITQVGAVGLLERHPEGHAILFHRQHPALLCLLVQVGFHAISV